MNYNIYFVRVNTVAHKVNVGDIRGRAIQPNCEFSVEAGTGIDTKADMGMNEMALRGAVVALNDAVKNKIGYVKINMLESASAIAKHVQACAFKNSTDYLSGFDKTPEKDKAGITEACTALAQLINAVRAYEGRVEFSPKNQWAMSIIWSSLPGIKLKDCYVEVTDKKEAYLPFFKKDGSICNWKVQHTDRAILQAGRYSLVALPYSKSKTAKSTGKHYQWAMVNKNIAETGNEIIAQLDKAINLTVKKEEVAVNAPVAIQPQDMFF